MPTIDDLTCPNCGQTGRFTALAPDFWCCQRCQSIVPSPPPAGDPPEADPSTILCDCGRPAKHSLSVKVLSPRLNTRGRTEELNLCDDCLALEREMQPQNGPNVRPVKPAKKPKKRRRRKKRQTAAFADFSLAKQQHIRSVLAVLRQAVVEARAEVQGDLE